MGHLLAVDAGTGGCRATAFTDQGEPVAEARRAWTLAPGPRWPGSVAFDTAPSLLNLPVHDPPRTRATLFRALLENAALLTRANLDTIEASHGHRPARLAFGGGAARSPLWGQILADVLGRPVRVPAVTEATALGAAILAGAGVGAFGDAAATATALAVGGQVHEPDPATAPAYEEAFGRWRAAYASELQLVEQGVTTPLWTAPGQDRAATDDQGGRE